MTDGNRHPDQEPVPPASTGWSQEQDDADDELAPPFLPGAAPAAGGREAPAVEPETPAGAEEAGQETEEGAFPFDAGWEQAETGADPDDTFPVEAFEIEGGPEGPSASAAADAWEATETGGGDAHELADRLEAMARRIRAEGAVAAESEMSSPDRFTALLAGLLAGYLAGRQ